MAQFLNESEIPFPRTLVYTTLRDRMPEVVAFMPNVERIEMLESERVSEGVQRYLNRWHVDPGEIPKVARPFVKPNQLYWMDRARWLEADFATEFELEFPFFDDAITVKGRNHYEEMGPDRTRFVGRTTFLLDLTKVRGLPNFLARRAGPKVEAWVSRMIEPNFQVLPQAVSQFLQANPPGDA